MPSPTGIANVTLSESEDPMALPIIGITTYGRNEENHFTLPAEYIEAVRNAGGLP